MSVSLSPAPSTVYREGVHAVQVRTAVTERPLPPTIDPKTAALRAARERRDAAAPAVAITVAEAPIAKEAKAKEPKAKEAKVEPILPPAPPLPSSPCSLPLYLQ